MKRKGLPISVGIIIILPTMAVVIALTVTDLSKNDWKIESGALTKPGLVMAGLVLSLVKLITRSGNSRSLRIYERAYEKEIGNAFSRSDTKKYKKKLLSALALYNDDDYAGAIKVLSDLEKVCNTADDYSAVLLFKALCFTDSGNPKAALSEYETLLKYNEKHSQAWSNLGILQNKLGKIDQSLKCYENAIKYDPDNANAHNNLAQAYMAECRWNDVIAPALRALELKSNMYQADNALTIAYYALGNIEESRKHFEHAVANGAKAENLTRILDSLAQGINPFGKGAEIRDEVNRAIGFIKRDTAIPMVEVRLPAPDDGNKTRLGGAPIDADIPLDREGNRMFLLAAIWCSEVRGVPDFPERGVLRFYISGNDYYGLDLDEPNVQSDFRVLYDEDEDKFDGSLRDDPELPDHFPVKHVYPVRLSPAMGSMLSSDYRFEEAMHSALKKAGFDNGVRDLNHDERDLIYDENSYGGHRIGGYPCFEQDDLRDSDYNLRKYDTLLLQIVSHTMPNSEGEEEELIMFGDCGGCQFFIPREKLRERDFSDVLYNWDCQ
jgi:uncharacterized protein YwqG/Tfp pilus assembly protein PilF